jgi:Domain of unknown function (DUF1707)/Cell wall-active antibiotics response 4TMS YvqF
VAETPEPVSARELRASDVDRDAVAEQLRDAAAHGRITMDELEERLELAYGAKTYAELAPITRDLPADGRSAVPVVAPRSAPAPRDRIGGTPTRRGAFALLGGATRKGDWVVPAQYKATAVLGGVDIDLREARFAEQLTVIHATAFLGGINIVVDEGVEVHVDGIGILGAFEQSSSSGSTSAAVGRPVVRITGFALMAGVNVEVKPPKGSKKKAKELDS